MKLNHFKQKKKNLLGSKSGFFDVLEWRTEKQVGTHLSSLHPSLLSPLFHKNFTLRLGGEFTAPHFWIQAKLADHLSTTSPNSQERICLAELR